MAGAKSRILPHLPALRGRRPTGWGTSRCLLARSVARTCCLLAMAKIGPLHRRRSVALFWTRDRGKDSGEKSGEMLRIQYLGNDSLRIRGYAVYLLGAAPHFRHRKNFGCELARSAANAVPDIKGRFSTLWSLNGYLECGATPHTSPVAV